MPNRQTSEQLPPDRDWEEQLDHDAESGKLDFLFDEAAKEAAAGTLHNWPEEQ